MRSVRLWEWKIGWNLSKHVAHQIMFVNSNAIKLFKIGQWDWCCCSWLCFQDKTKGYLVSHRYDLPSSSLWMVLYKWFICTSIENWCNKEHQIFSIALHYKVCESIPWCDKTKHVYRFIYVVCSHDRFKKWNNGPVPGTEIRRPAPRTSTCSHEQSGIHVLSIWQWTADTCMCVWDLFFWEHVEDMLWINSFVFFCIQSEFRGCYWRLCW